MAVSRKFWKQMVLQQHWKSVRLSPATRSWFHHITTHTFSVTSTRKSHYLFSRKVSSNHSRYVTARTRTNAVGSTVVSAQCSINYTEKNCLTTTYSTLTQRFNSWPSSKTTTRHSPF